MSLFPYTSFCLMYKIYRLPLQTRFQWLIGRFNILFFCTQRQCWFQKGHPPREKCNFPPRRFEILCFQWLKSTISAQNSTLQLGILHCIKFTRLNFYEEPEIVTHSDWNFWNMPQYKLLLFNVGYLILLLISKLYSKIPASFDAKKKLKTLYKNKTT